jgi:hypothetical protein
MYTRGSKKNAVLLWQQIPYSGWRRRVELVSALEGNYRRHSRPIGRATEDPGAPSGSTSSFLLTFIDDGFS